MTRHEPGGSTFLFALPVLAMLPVQHPQRASSDPTRANLKGTAGSAPAYTCDVEVLRGQEVARKLRIAYDRASFRQETLDPRSNRVKNLVVYSRDGQGLSFLYWRLHPPAAGVDLTGVMFRLARDSPAQFARMSGLPPGSRFQVGEPAPTYKLERLPHDPISAGFARHGTARSDGRLCELYERPGLALKVWKGYIVESTASNAALPETTRFEHILFRGSLPASLFALIPGTEVKVPRDLHVRLPRNVRRVEYPGVGLEGRPGLLPPRN